MRRPHTESPQSQKKSQPGEAGTKDHYRLRRAGMLLFQGFAPNPTYYAPKIFV